MSDDSFTEVTHESWFSRLGGAIKGVLAGLVIFAVSFPLLFWNEGRAVTTYKTLEEGGGAVVSVSADSVDSDNEGKLIHVTGKADTDETLADPDFGISANALKLRREVEMYQWKETTKSTKKKKLGGGTETVKTYSYSMVWAAEPINSGGFKKPTGHENPGAMPYESTRWVAEDVSLEAFQLSPSLVGMIGKSTPLPVTAETEIPEAIRETVKLHNKGFYLGADPASPAVGDTHVSFEVVEPTIVSVVASQIDDTFEPYSAEAGGTIELLQVGKHSAKAMIQKAQESNTMMTWILRLVGFIVMVIGLNMICRPLSVMADVIPILGDLVGAGTGIMSFLLAAVLSLITIAIAWVFYRPVLGVALILVAVGLAVFIGVRLKKAKAKG